MTAHVALAAAFLAAHGERDVPSELAAALDARLHAARSVWAELELDPHEFARFLAKDRADSDALVKIAKTPRTEYRP